jgi:hypothetical protein
VTAASPVNLLRRPYLSFEVADPPCGPVSMRFRAHLSAPRLDRALSAGVDPDTTPELAARAAQLCRHRTRHALAGALERVVADARSRRRNVGARIPAARADVRANAPALLALAARLRAGDPVAPRGVAATRALLCEPLSPLYHPSTPDDLRQAIDDARDALVPKEHSTWT